MNENNIPTTTTAERWVQRFSRFLSTGKFALFVLWVLFFYEVFVAVMTFAPVGSGAAGAFMEDFRIRCFSYQPGSGAMEWTSVFVMLAEPLPLGGIVCFIWWRQLKEIWRTGFRPLLSLGLSALMLVGALGIGLAGVSKAQAKEAEKFFPASRLRSALPLPAFELRDQDGEAVTPQSLKGRVVLMTAIYSTCTTACPMMLKNIRSVLDQLTPAERRELTVVAFSLNPEADTQELRSMIVNAYNFDCGKFHFVNGSAPEMNSLLDKLGVSRTRDEKTGEITHSTLLMLLDRRGRIAYRLSMSESEQPWHLAATRTLLAEPAH
jgi:protein SCO1/2